MKNIKLFEEFSLEINESIVVPNEYIDFLNMLKNHGIDTDLYGTGTYKTKLTIFHWLIAAKPNSVIPARNKTKQAILSVVKSVGLSLNFNPLIPLKSV